MYFVKTVVQMKQKCIKFMIKNVMILSFSLRNNVNTKQLHVTR